MLVCIACVCAGVWLGLQCSAICVTCSVQTCESCALWPFCSTWQLSRAYEEACEQECHMQGGELLAGLRLTKTTDGSINSSCVVTHYYQ